MAYSNISAALDPAKKTEITTKLNDIKNALPFLVNLTPKQRRELRKMGDELTSYVQDVIVTAKAYPQAIPATINLGECEKDLKLIKDLQELQVQVLALAEGISDSIIALGNEAVTSAGLAYTALKQAAKTDSKLDQNVKNLGQRFKKSKPKTIIGAKS